MTRDIETLKQKQTEIQSEARKLQQESASDLYRHELFARSVAALQIAISLGAVAVLLRKRAVWYVSLSIAVVGLGFMVVGSLPSQTAHLETRASVDLTN